MEVVRVVLSGEGFRSVLATPATVADFLVHVAHRKAASTSTLAGYRSAIGNVLRLTTGYDPGTCPLLSQLMKSFKRTQPIPSRRIPVWDISLVLRVLSSEVAVNEKLSLRLLTAKTIFLVALASGDRCSAIAALKSPPVEFSDSVVVEFHDEFVPKSYFLKRNLSRIKPLTLLRVEQESLGQVCPCRAVLHYCDRVRELRGESQFSLFIPHNLSKKTNIKPQSIARYITYIVSWCYEQEGANAPESRAHDVRKVATSMRDLSSTSLSQLLEAGHWSTPHMFLKHYKTSFSEECKSALESFQGVATANSRFSLQSTST